MPRGAPDRPPRKRRDRFALGRFLTSTRTGRRVTEHPVGARVYTQGDPARAVMYIQDGRIKLSVVSRAGKEAVLAVLHAGDFFGEGCLAGQTVRMGTATAMVPTRVLAVDRQRMRQLLHRQPALSKRFMAHVLARNIRVEEDLIDRLFHSAEKRFARVLILMARYGRSQGDAWVLPRISQETLAEMVGTTRPRVNFFMNKFRSLGFIDYNGELVVRTALLSLVLHDRS